MLIRGKRVTDRQAEIYELLSRYGPLPDHALVPMAQHVIKLRQSSSGIRTRRAELMDMGLVAQQGTTTTGSGRRAGVFEVIR